MPNLMVYTNGKKPDGTSTQKVRLTNKNTGGPPDIDRIKQIEINYLWITTSGPNPLVSGKYISFTGPGSAGLTAVIMGSGLFEANLVVWFYVYPPIHVEEKDPDRILGLLGDLVVTVETTGAPDTGTDPKITEGP